jgi:high affinity Mn2+ porin
MRLTLIAASCILAAAALASEAAAEEDGSAFEFHAQSTYVRQFKPAMRALYGGENSLRAAREASYSFTSTLYLAARRGDTELYLNPEFVQGVSFSGLHGLGGFSNGEIQRTSGAILRGYRARFFARHTWNLGGGFEEQPSEQNHVKTRYAAERFVLTAGNVSVLDVFDVLDYSHDPRTQFMNWSSTTYGAWDFPADARGYTWGVAGEYITPLWQARIGRFLVPVESNGLRLQYNLTRRYGDVAEFEVPYTLAGRPAIARALVFRNRVNAGAFDDALALSAATGATPDVTLVRRTQSKRGFGISTQVEVTDDLGAYVRAGWNDGKTETFMFTEIDRSLAAGALVKGGAWGRPDDRLGVAAYRNGLAPPHRNYLAAGGLGFFLGDGRLNYGAERIVETFYSLAVNKYLSLSLGYQRVANPGYNRDRGPADFVGFRLHAEI